MIRKYSDFLRVIVAKTGVIYDHSSTQIDLNQDISNEVLEWGKINIPNDALFEDDLDKGRENDIHCTLLYGLKTTDPSDVQRLIPKDMHEITLRFGLITAFMTKPDYDVLKIDIESPELLRLHYILRNNLENDNSYPDYQSHLTVAYLKKGQALKYIGDDNFRYRTFVTPVIQFSPPNAEKIEIRLG